MQFYSLFVVGVYSENDADLICMMPGKLGGITQLQFSKNGFLLYAGARQVRSLSISVTNLPK